jgi:hypothetical protein
LIPAVIHIFDTAPPTSPQHDEDIEDFDENEDEEDEDPENMGTKALSDDEENEAEEHVILSQVTSTTEDTGVHVGRSALSEDGDAVFVAT